MKRGRGVEGGNKGLDMFIETEWKCCFYYGTLECLGSGVDGDANK